MNDNIKKDTTCFSSHKKFNVPCAKTDCRYYLENPDGLNCVINMSNNNPRTMQSVGDLFNITRMRICQIEKSILNKIRKNIEQNSY